MASILELIPFSNHSLAQSFSTPDKLNLFDFFDLQVSCLDEFWNQIKDSTFHVNLSHFDADSEVDEVIIIYCQTTSNMHD
jgi:hypothetical protein